MKEIWKPIREYEGLYEVSNLGNVRSVSKKWGKREKGYYLYKSKTLYYMVKLSKNNKKRMKSIHRLVAEAFIPNPENKQQINHINGNKYDNRVENLEWVTPNENMIHAYKSGLEKPTKTSAVNQYDIDGNFIQHWNTIKEAKIYLKNNSLHITDVCLGKRKTAGGFVWKYVGKEECNNA